jgi:hypothetical protein
MCPLMLTTSVIPIALCPLMLTICVIPLALCPLKLATCVTPLAMCPLMLTTCVFPHYRLTLTRITLEGAVNTPYPGFGEQSVPLCWLIMAGRGDIHTTDTSEDWTERSLDC